MKEEDKKPNPLMRYAGLSTQWMAMLLIAVWAGVQLDKKNRMALSVVRSTPACYSVGSIFMVIN